MKYYLDTEFNEDGCTIDLISLALVCEDGRELYVLNREAELHRVNDWVRENVLPQLPSYGDPRWMTRDQIGDEIVNFVVDPVPRRAKPEFFAYYADYDWVALCQIFGTMMDLPDLFPKLCMDLRQLAVAKGDPELPKQLTGEHDALVNARWNMQVHRFLENLP